VNGEASTQTLPTIVLISGQLTLSDGSEVNSRQDATDDMTAYALQDALTGCAEWWSTVSSIVVPTLEDPEGGFAVIFSPRRSILHVTSDGEIHRRALRKFLRGTFGSVSVKRSTKGESLPADYRSLVRLRSPKGADMGAVGVRFDNPTPRWSIVDGIDYYFGIVANRMSRIIVDATGTFLNFTNGLYSTFPCEYSVAPQLQIVVMPDTVDVRDCIADHLAGKIPEPSQLPETPAPDVSPGAPRDPADFLRIPVLRAACSVTGLLRAGQWEDAAGLEAARMLLLKRYDLKLGLWDLALNPVLRSTALESLPVQPAPDEPVQAPAKEWKRAERKAEKATARGEAKQLKIRQANAALKQELEPVGWRLDHDLLPRANVEKYGPWLYLPLTEPTPVWKGEVQPLVALRIDVRANSIRLVVWHFLPSGYDELDIGAFIEQRREDFESVLPLPPFPKALNEVPLWTASIGWNDTEAEWSSIAKEIAEHTKRWVEVLADFVASARKVRDELIKSRERAHTASAVHNIVIRLSDLIELPKKP
jgi:hypothetical protein